MDNQERPLVEQARILASQQPKGPCPECGEESPRFKKHDQRNRKLRVIDGNFVRVLVVVLGRWECCHCGRTFTHYPSFIQRHKRYALDDLLRIASSYLFDEDATYREASSQCGSPLGYEQQECGGIDERQMDHSTPRRWVGWLGGLTQLLHAALNLLRQTNSAFWLHRFPLVIPRQKYRNTTRRQMLQCAQLLLITAADYTRHFGQTIFPTLCHSHPVHPC